MIRFRRTEDEERYGVLRAEFVARIASALPPKVLNEVLRNFGKLETMWHVEGMRQGVAAAAIAEMMDQSPATRDAQVHPKSLKAFQLHAAIYGSADTPLRDAEKAQLRRIGAPEDFLSASWLDDSPMHFEPKSLSELAGAEVPVHRVTVSEPIPESLPVVAPPPEDEIPPEILQILKEDDASQSEPMFLDRVRDVLLAAMKDGWKPADYNDLLMKIHTTIGADPWFTDIQISTEIGRTMLMQVGITDLAPPPQVDARAMFTFVERLEPLNASPPTPPPDGDQQGDGSKG